MRYDKQVADGYIVSISTADGNETDGNITAAEYEQLEEIIHNRPTAPEGYLYRLRTNLTWELVESPQEEPEQTLEERIAELEEALEMILSGVTEDE